MTPEWVAEAHAVWLRGDDVDVVQVRNVTTVWLKLTVRPRAYPSTDSLFSQASYYPSPASKTFTDALKSTDL